MRFSAAVNLMCRSKPESSGSPAGQAQKSGLVSSNILRLMPDHATTRAKQETENKAKADWTTDEFAEDMVNKIKKKIQEGNVDHIRITRGSQTLLDIPVNLGIIGGLLGMATIPWAMILGVLAGYGVGCKVEIVNKDGGSEEL